MAINVHHRGNYVCMEGPAFSTKAESNLYRSWGMDIIGMTVLPEAKLAREAEICYTTMAFVTDFDCWHEEHESVSVEMVIANLLHNVDTAKKIIAKLIPIIPDTERTCHCARALKNAIMTNPKVFPSATKKKLQLFIGEIF
jgi:5'-methylthioadenosine phosphorylase